MQLSFTPLVSPAVTPLEAQFPSENQFAVHPTYFSPLSSPALHAQNEGVAYDHLAGVRMDSPVDMLVDPTPASGMSAAGAADLSKKIRKTNAVAKSRAKGGVRQSPIGKPKKRTSSTPNIAKKVINELAENTPNTPSVTLPGPAQSAIHTDTSEEDGSVSPEAPTDMPPPPPPQPRSARQSPYMQAKKQISAGQAKANSRVSPATPASLMKLPSPSVQDTSTVANGSHVVASESIDKLELPESITCKPRPTVNTQHASQGSSKQATTKETVSIPAPTPSPVFAKPSGTPSASQSPQIPSGLSASGGHTRQTPQLSARSSKKRASASVQSSPALRPKISPSIKPLLPSATGFSAEDTASRLLATKSNYQNILEGNKVPGVTYPSELSTNLTSKRTSHKIAEQGRRNRINTALQEIATLLPGEANGEGTENGERKEGKQGGLPNSKASTVELAIKYIKELQKSVDCERQRADAAERRLKLLGAS